MTQSKGPGHPEESTSELKPKEGVGVSQDLGCQGYHSKSQVVSESGQTGVSCLHGKTPTHLPLLLLSGTSLCNLDLQDGLESRQVRD